ncbi:ankyrin repeat domain-containing protein 29 [Apiospora sp. TS-2023a]
MVQRRSTDKAKLLHGQLPATLRAEISDQLLSGAKGMFRWVELQIQSLRRLKVAADIKARLGHLPETLEGAYWEVYQQILSSGENAAKLAIFTFQWLLYARQTIPLESFFQNMASKTTSEDIDRSQRYKSLVNSQTTLEDASSPPEQPAKGNTDADMDKESTPDQASGDNDEENKVSNATSAEFHAGTNSEAHNDDKPTLSMIRVTRYAVAFWAHHVSASKSLRTEHLGYLLKTFLVNGNEKTVAAGFIVWCRLLQCMHDGPDDTDLKDAASEPPNPLWAIFIFNWPDIAGDLYEANYPEIEGNRKLEHAASKYSLESWELNMSPLLYAVTAGYNKLAQNLVYLRSKLPANLLIENRQQGTTSVKSPLYRATALKNTELVVYLLDNGYGSPDTLAESFACAAKAGNLELLEVFLQKGVNIQSVGYESLTNAIDGGHPAAVTFILDHGGPTNPGGRLLSSAVSLCHVDVSRILLERGIGLERLADVFALAVTNDFNDMESMLLEHNAQKNPVAIVRQIVHDAENAALKLIEAGWELNGRHLEKRRTALHYAAEKGYGKVVVALLERGVILDVFDRNRNTPLHLAALRGREDCVELLLSHGADVLAEDRDGKIALDMAETHHHASTERLIRKHMENMVEDLRSKIAERVDQPQGTPGPAVTRGESALC